jgi:hypothetical protein
MAKIKHNSCISYAIFSRSSQFLLEANFFRGGHDVIAQLVDTHPALFHQTIPPCSEVPEGWYAMADALCTAIEASMSPNELRYFHIRQIAEESGSLHVYPAGIWTEKVQSLINTVEKMSTLTCMECGSPGHVRHAHPRVTLCDFCEEERQIRANRCKHGK